MSEQYPTSDGASTAECTADEPVLDVLAAMTAASIERTSLDEQTLMLVRLAALVAVDAPPLSYLLNLQVAGEVGVSTEQIQGVLTAIAPVLGGPRIVAAAGNIARAVGIEIAVAEAELAAESAADADVDGGAGVAPAGGARAG
jgi:alkylhydroperoxidase/carboxymuconolactone decarboxylase family protein YurZ